MSLTGRCELLLKPARTIIPILRWITTQISRCQLQIDALWSGRVQDFTTDGDSMGQLWVLSVLSCHYKLNQIKTKLDTKST